MRYMTPFSADHFPAQTLIKVHLKVHFKVTKSFENLVFAGTNYEVGYRFSFEGSKILISTGSHIPSKSILATCSLNLFLPDEYRNIFKYGYFIIGLKTIL